MLRYAMACEGVKSVIMEEHGLKVVHCRVSYNPVRWLTSYQCFACRVALWKFGRKRGRLTCRRGVLPCRSLTLTLTSSASRRISKISIIYNSSLSGTWGLGIDLAAAKVLGTTASCRAANFRSTFGFQTDKSLGINFRTIWAGWRARIA